jgi:hypothetical protein
MRQALIGQDSLCLAWQSSQDRARKTAVPVEIQPGLTDDTNLELKRLFQLKCFI